LNKQTIRSAEFLPDQTGRVFIVTGANSGIGFETSLGLAGRGARVILAVRDLGRGEIAAAFIRQVHAVADLDVRLLDLASLASIRQFAEGLNRDFNQLDGLVNNAGLMALPRRTTADGFEMQFGVNHLGHFALTGLLLERLLAAPAGRVVTVSSGMHAMGMINFNDLNGEKKYARWAAYSQSKLANLLFAYELQRRLADSGANLISVGAHPGFSATNLQSAAARMDGSTFGAQAANLASKAFAQSAAMGALPILVAVAAPGVAGGEYYGPNGWGGARGYPARIKSSPASYDQETAARLWEVSSRLTGVEYKFRLPVV
jgi:NAD(P)-dependent dehydrogenase (short-subunit alcohol dehydrogenase family)